MSTADSERETLEESLRLCQLELGQVRAEQEPLIEDLARERDRRRAAEADCEKLAQAISEALAAPPGGSTLPAKVRRLAVRYQRSRSPEWRQAELLNSSRPFSASWYLRRYPETVLTGLPPALHYLRFGATEGKDPGPGFNTTKYLREHPEVLASGTNPLVHHLENRRRNSSKLTKR